MEQSIDCILNRPKLIANGPDDSLYITTESAFQKWMDSVHPSCGEMKAILANPLTVVKPKFLPLMANVVAYRTDFWKKFNAIKSLVESMEICRSGEGEGDSVVTEADIADVRESVTRALRDFILCDPSGELLGVLLNHKMLTDAKCLSSTILLLDVLGDTNLAIKEKKTECIARLFLDVFSLSGLSGLRDAQECVRMLCGGCLSKADVSVVWKKVRELARDYGQEKAVSCISGDDLNCALYGPFSDSILKRASNLCVGFTNPEEIATRVLHGVMD